MPVRRRRRRSSKLRKEGKKKCWSGVKRDGAKMQYWELALFSFILLSCYAGSFFLLLLFLLPPPPPPACSSSPFHG